MVKQGFQPQNIQINKDDKINFLNEDEVDRWPASNIHPTHAIYPGFDPKKPIKRDGFWEFKFENTGVFRFHDHLNPELTGTITVNGVNTSKQTSMNQSLREKLAIIYKKLYYRFYSKKLEQDLKSFNAIETASHEKELAFWLQIIGGQK